MYTSTIAVLLLVAARSVYAAGCATHTYGSCADGIVHWYDPDDGQICDPLDCGGGRAPVKTTVPCCAAYVGTASCNTEPSYMPCFTARSTYSSSPISTAQDTQVTTTTTTNAALTTTTAATESGSGSQATVTPTGSGSGSGSDVTSTMTTAATGTVTNGGSLTTSSTDSSSVSVATGAAGHVHHNPFMALVGAAFGVALL